MKPRRLSLLAWLALAPAALAAPTARASLGGAATGVAADAAALGGTPSTIPMQRYDLHEIAIEGGLMVREYATLDGTVFAVSWRGPVVPDLRLLLGDRYAEYEKAVVALRRPGLQRSVALRLPDLVVELDGALRGYTGRAYLPAWIPPGVSTADLR